MGVVRREMKERLIVYTQNQGIVAKPDRRGKVTAMSGLCVELLGE